MADNDSPKFDVYGMLLVLSVLATGGAAFLLYDDLTTNWGYGQPTTKVAVNLTQANDDPATNPDTVSVRKVDLDEWKLIKPKDTFPVTGFEWPEGYDPLKFPVKPDQDNLKDDKIPADMRKKLVPE